VWRGGTSQDNTHCRFQCILSFRHVLEVMKVTQNHERPKILSPTTKEKNTYNNHKSGNTHNTDTLAS